MIPNIKQQYRELIKSFLIENNIKEVICKDTKEHFFDKIIVTDKENRIIKVYTTDELIEITWNNLYLHFTCDYAQCIAKFLTNLHFVTNFNKMLSLC